MLPHFAEKILSSRTALEGERKQVTVLFADLKGSPELLADRDPEEARQLLDPVLGRMMGLCAYSHSSRFVLNGWDPHAGHASLTSITVCEPPRYSWVIWVKDTRGSRAEHSSYNTTVL
jgi:hypothetical protein